MRQVPPTYNIGRSVKCKILRSCKSKWMLTIPSTLRLHPALIFSEGWARSGYGEGARHTIPLMGLQLRLGSIVVTGLLHSLSQPTRPGRPIQAGLHLIRAKPKPVPSEPCWVTCLVSVPWPIYRGFVRPIKAPQWRIHNEAGTTRLLSLSAQ